MAKKKKFLRKLAADYDFQTERQFVEYLFDTYTNGNRESARALFRQVIEQDRVIAYLRDYLQAEQVLDFLECVLIGE